MRATTRKYIDCREYPSESNCSLYLEGTEDELVRAATDHAVAVHQHPNTQETVSAIRAAIRDVVD